uniref:Putative secreted peptide n=1 Tax=Anopheles braziliensis TaxID=58242 RepID=A0A2M3ZXG5_9DIPT
MQETVFRVRRLLLLLLTAPAVELLVVPGTTIGPPATVCLRLGFGESEKLLEGRFSEPVPRPPVLPVVMYCW